MKTERFLLIAGLMLILFNTTLSGHCDTMDGPVVADARKAIETGNVNYALKWVMPGNENEVKDVFNQIVQVRLLSPAAAEVSDMYFFETVVRLHRIGEGMSYQGIKPSGTPVDEKIIAADEALESGDMVHLSELVESGRVPELEELFNKAVELKDFDVDDVSAGREYIESYVRFFHFAEGEEESHELDAVASGSGAVYLPWILSALFLIVSVTFAMLYLKRLNIR